MRIERRNGGIWLIREKGDKALSKESAVTHHMRRLLNGADGGGWKRFWPCRIGLTGCAQGVRRGDIMFWHEAYQVELAHQAFNHGKVFYLEA